MLSTPIVHSSPTARPAAFTRRPFGPSGSPKIAGGKLRIRRDHVLEDMLRGLGAHLAVIVALAAVPTSLLVIEFIDSERQDAIDDAVELLAGDINGLGGPVPGTPTLRTAVGNSAEECSAKA